MPDFASPAPANASKIHLAAFRRAVLRLHPRGMSISIYDMDRTLTRRGTFVPWLQFWLRTEAPWRVVLLPLLLLPALAYGLGWIDRGALKAAAHRVVMGNAVPRARVAAAAARFAEHIVSAELFPAALAALAADRQAGARIVIATASNACYADAIGARLGAETVIATASTWDGDHLRAALGSANCYGTAKRDRVAEWLAVNAAAGSDVRFYSDHQSDLPTFELVVERGGRAVATNPTPALRAEAVARGWSVIDWGEAASSWFERA
jgi:HAD superfamily phosphoserine phosphatase-like hydrolase